MYGFCALKVLVLVSAALIGASVAHAQTSAPARPTNSQRAIISVEEGTVFDKPDFDGEVVAILPGGGEYTISIAKRGIFHRIRYAPGKSGWISEAEVAPKGSAAASAAAAGARPRERAREDNQTLLGSAREKTAPKRSKPIEERRFLGPVFENVSFLEDTMGKVRGSNVPMFGLRLSGPDTMISGLISMDSQILVLSGAPDHYSRATGQRAGGFMLLGSTVFITEIPTSDNLMAYYGFGPLVRLNRFEATLQNDPGPGQKRTYALEDLVLGAVFQLGVVIGFSPVALRIDGRYFWELQRYNSFSLGLQWEL